MPTRSVTDLTALCVGRQIRDFDQAVWEAHRYDIVVAGSIAKFSQHHDLKNFLMGTGGRVLVEASPVDRIWACVTTSVQE